MAEKANPKSQPGKEQPSPRRRAQVPHARPALEATALSWHARDPATPAAPSAATRSRAPAAGHRPSIPNARDTPGSAGAARSRAGDPEDGEDPSRSRVRVARLTEAGLRQLGGVSSYQRILEWLDGTFASRAEAMAELQGELREELDGCWEPEEHGSSWGGKGL
ncbi:hypothetical protein DUI87_22117 [Hirundo rustica rustica]|uniref:Uncharacterized protein n=1 Tax=Hirundo rustica rustica TaxID=333673 RepID=A0A3M0IQ59_HIRRU|nr:hypothetical protein DUI87_33010 [Hirundo rustica rustica]RMC01328.1 hypothetical protein DUI87_22117 [Hirundo rustica rustica]